MAETHQSLLALLVGYERQLHRPDIRRQRKVVERLLHNDFFEIGRSGKRYGKQQVIDALANETMEEIHSDDFALSALSADCVLLTYQSFNVDAQATLNKTLRTSLWVRCEANINQWQMRFHQGTPAAQ